MAQVNARCAEQRRRRKKNHQTKKKNGSECEQNIHFHVICTIYLVLCNVHGWWESTIDHTTLHHAYTAQLQLHLHSLPCWCLVHISMRKAANDRIILAASCLFVEVSCGISLRPWQMQWEMSSKPYHSFVQARYFLAQEEMWRNVKSRKVTKLITGFDAVVFPSIACEHSLYTISLAHTQEPEPEPKQKQQNIPWHNIFASILNN